MTAARTAGRLRRKLLGLIRHPEFRLGAREISSVAPGLAAWGLMTGVAMVNAGMSVLEAVAMTLLVFAGSSQLAAIPLIAASAPVWVILAAGFCVNLRFVVFSAHLRSYVMHLPRPVRLRPGKAGSSALAGRDGGTLTAYSLLPRGTLQFFRPAACQRFSQLFVLCESP